MGIFNTYYSDNINCESYNGAMDASIESSDAILYEAAEEFYKINAGLYVADIMIESAVLEGANESVLIEGAVGNVIEKIKNAFKKLWAKIKAWFGQVKRFFKILFMNGKKFVNEFKIEINHKEGKGFTYNGWVWDIDKATDKAKEKIGLIDKLYNGVVSDIKKATDELKDSRSKYITSIKDNYDYDSITEFLDKEMGNVELGDFLKDLEETAHGGTSKEEVENFDQGMSKDGMMNYIVGNGKAIKEIEDADKEVDKNFKNIINALNSAEKSYLSATKSNTDNNASVIGSVVSKLSAVGRAALTRNQSINSRLIELMKQCAKDYESILKAFLRYKPKKESFGSYYDDDDNTNNVLEQAMKYI